MCLLIILREVVSDWGLVVAANRDERYDRGGEPPQVLSDEPRLFGGRDPKAGGTWLAVNQWGMLCAVTNRPRKERPDRPVRSRGLLCLDAARQKSPIAVADHLGNALAQDAYEGFTLFSATPSTGSFFYFDGGLREKPLGRGVFVVTTGDANDASIPKVRRAHELLDAGKAQSIADWIDGLETVCRNHSGNPSHPNALCLHGGKGGTVSSSIVAFHDREPERHLFRHCQGRPCEAPYETVAWPGGFFVGAPVPSQQDD